MMNAGVDTLPYRDQPTFLPKTQQLLDRLRAMDGGERWHGALTC